MNTVSQTLTLRINNTALHKCFCDLTALSLKDSLKDFSPLRTTDNRALPFCPSHQPVPTAEPRAGGVSCQRTPPRPVPGAPFSSFSSPPAQSPPPIRAPHQRPQSQPSPKQPTPTPRVPFPSQKLSREALDYSLLSCFLSTPHHTVHGSKRFSVLSHLTPEAVPGTQQPFSGVS